MKRNKTVVLGYGVSGKAAAKFLQARGAEVIVVDDRGDVKEYDGEFDLLVPSPGVPPSHPLYQKALALSIPVVGEAELALRSLKQKVIGITGTNGKTTVTELTAHVLNYCGISAVALGNVGRPLTEWALSEHGDEVVVAELSSYQLETMEAKSLDQAVILNISPDHLDRYGSIEAYTAAKMRIEQCLKPPGKLLMKEGKNSYITQDLDPPTTFEEENQHAAYSLTKPFGITAPLFREALKSFRKPPHRLEFIKEVKGVRYYNDSKGTNIEAVNQAVESFAGKIYLIAGGQDKGESYTPWLSTFSGKVAAIALVGEAAEKIERDLAGAFPTKQCGTLPKAFAYCQAKANPGDIVLLSPGCSSFDQYRCFEERGEEFRKLVNCII